MYDVAALHVTVSYTIFVVNLLLKTKKIVCTYFSTNLYSNQFSLCHTLRIKAALKQKDARLLMAFFGRKFG